MLYAFVAGLRMCWIAAVLLSATIHAGEPPHPLMGLTRDQILNRLGEPRSQMMAGGREVMFYPRERLVLTNGVVVEVERLVADFPRKAPAPEASPRAPGPGSTANAAEGTESATKSADATARPAEPAEPAESKVEIKLVRPPSAVTPSAAVEPEPAPEPVKPVVSSPPVAIAPAVPSPAEALNSSASAPARTPPAGTTVTPPAPKAPVAAPATKAAAPAPTASPAAPSVARTQSSNTPAAPAAGSGLGLSLFVVGGVVLLGAVGYFVWRSRQRQLELEATAVDATPVGAAAVSRAVEAGFSAPFLASLDAARFEELVAAYYAKTGVVATRVPSDPASPFQIRISWKGEARPFALVQCLAQPEGAVDTKPLLRLHAVLEKEKLRRGYVVTPGKFAPAAREFAEQKGLTLLPGDVLLEKLMALPDSARSELMRAIIPGAARSAS